MNKITFENADIETNDVNLHVKFSEGLNIVCGKNEAGKSTLYTFLTNTFSQNGNQKGKAQITFAAGNEKYEVKFDKTTKKPETDEKTANFINSEIDKFYFREAFGITADELMFASKENDVKKSAFFKAVRDLSGETLTREEQIITKEFETMITANTNRIKKNSILDVLGKQIKEKEEKIPELYEKQKDLAIFKKNLEDIEEKIKNLKTEEAELSKALKKAETYEKFYNLKEKAQSVKNSLNEKLLNVTPDKYKELSEKFIVNETQIKSAEEALSECEIPEKPADEPPKSDVKIAACLLVAAVVSTVIGIFTNPVFGTAITFFLFAAALCVYLIYRNNLNRYTALHENFKSKKNEVEQKIASLKAKIDKLQNENDEITREFLNFENKTEIKFEKNSVGEKFAQICTICSEQKFLRQNFEEIENELKSFDFDETEEKPDKTVISDKLACLKDSLDEALKKKGEMKARIAGLTNCSSLTELKSEIKNLKDEYLNMTEHAVYLASMLKLLQKAKEKFNEEQINVREAEKFLKELTCGKYDKADAEKIEITDENGFSKKYDKLSRGTAEQFYLSLRLGYASNYEKNTKGKMPPPLLVDDAFVNFDKERTERAIGCLYDFSKTNQVIYFTCRGEEVCEVLDKAGMPDVTKIYI